MFSIKRTGVAACLLMVSVAANAAMSGTPPTLTGGFVGDVDSGTVHVKSCNGAGQLPGVAKFSSNNIVGVGLHISMPGTGLKLGSETFVANYYSGPSSFFTMMKGNFVLVNSDATGKVFTYMLAPDGTTADTWANLSAGFPSSGTGWAYFLDFLAFEASSACNGMYTNVYPPTSSVTVVLIVDTGTTSGPGYKAVLTIKAKTEIDGFSPTVTDNVGQLGVDDVTFNYRSTGYVY